jgi:hypothetical protein
METNEYNFGEPTHHMHMHMQVVHLECFLAIFLVFYGIIIGTVNQICFKCVCTVYLNGLTEEGTR